MLQSRCSVESISINAMLKCNLYFIFISVLCVQLISSQVPLTGNKCAEKSPSSPIDIRKITGQWYEIEASPVITEWPFKCISLKVSAFFEKRSKIKVEVVHRLKEEGVISQLLNISLPQASDGKDGKLIIGWTPTQNSSEEIEGGVIYGDHFKLNTIQILATDYTNWALIWSCRPFEKANARSEQVWIVSRYRTLESKYYEEVREAIINFNLEGIRTFETIQKGCTAEEEAT